MDLIKFDNLQSVVDEIEQAFYDIPFENSSYQNVFFVVNAQHTPARAYRALGLKMLSKIQALREAQTNLALENIDIEEMQEQLNSPDTSPYEKRRIEIKLQKKMFDRRHTEKLINDALVELTVLYQIFQKMPRYTREQFEAEEAQHFEIRLKKQAAGITGALESLDNMGLLDTKGSEFEKIPSVLQRLGVSFEGLQVDFDDSRKKITE